MSKNIVMSSHHLKKMKFTFALIYFLLMFTRALLSPFISVFLQDKGLSTEQIGLVTGFNSFIIILAQPIWGIISDKIHSAKKTLVFCSILDAVFAISLIFANQFFLIATCFAIYTSFNSPSNTLMDSWTLRTMKESGDANAVGRLKLWGCVGFSISSVVAGQFVSRSSIDSIIPVYSAILLGIAIFLSFIKTNDQGGKSEKLKDMQLHRIFKDKTFLIFLVYIFFMQLAHRGSFTFYPLLIKQLGGGNNIVGYASALMFVSEATIMFFSKKMLSRVRPEKLVMLSSLSFVLWHVMLSLSTSPYHVMLSCIMDGPSFALFTLGTLYYLDYLAPKELRTTYQTVAYSVYFGLSGIVGNMGSGWLIENLGYRGMYGIGITVTLCSTLLFFLYTRARAAKNR